MQGTRAGQLMQNKTRPSQIDEPSKNQFSFQPTCILRFTRWCIFQYFYQFLYFCLYCINIKSYILFPIQIKFYQTNIQHINIKFSYKYFWDIAVYLFLWVQGSHRLKIPKLNEQCIQAQLPLLKSTFHIGTPDFCQYVIDQCPWSITWSWSGHTCH